MNKADVALTAGRSEGEILAKLLADQVVRFVRRAGLRPGTVLVACSGGPDSVALLRALHELGRKHQLSVAVAHLNHQLRGPASDADEAFVQGLAAAWQLPYYVGRSDVRSHATTMGQNLEAAARTVRYHWLMGRAREAGARYVATGHTANDQAETLLHHLLRGTGLRGLRGVAAVKRLSEGVELIRPLLQVERAAVLAYLQEQDQTYCTDVTNDELTLTRNRIRHELIPYLQREHHADVVTACSRLAEQVQEYWGDYEQRLHNILAKAEMPGTPGTIVLNAASLEGYGRQLISDVLYAIFERETWPRGEMSRSHWDRLVDVVRGELSAADLPGHVRIQRRTATIVLSRSVG